MNNEKLQWENKGVDGYGYGHQIAELQDEYALEIVHNDELSLVDTFTGESILIDIDSIVGIRKIKQWVKNNMDFLLELCDRANHEPLYKLSYQ